MSAFRTDGAGAWVVLRFPAGGTRVGSGRTVVDEGRRTNGRSRSRHGRTGPHLAVPTRAPASFRAAGGPPAPVGGARARLQPREGPADVRLRAHRPPDRLPSPGPTREGRFGG